MIKLVNAEIVPLTKELAIKFSSMLKSPVERDVTPSRHLSLIRRLSKGPLVPFVWSKAYFGGTAYRVNGQATSKIYANGDLEIPDNGIVSLSDYVVESLDEMHELWKQFDAKDSVKGTSQLLTSIIRSSGLFDDDFNAKVAERIRAGISLSLGKRVDDRDFVSNYSDFISFCDYMISQPNGRLLSKASVVAAMFDSYRLAGEDCEHFWSRVRDGSDDAGDVSEILRNYIKYTKVRSKVERKSLYEKSIIAWNHYRNGKRVKSLRKYTKGSLKAV